MGDFEDGGGMGATCGVRVGQGMVIAGGEVEAWGEVTGTGC